MNNISDLEIFARLAIIQRLEPAAKNMGISIQKIADALVNLEAKTGLPLFQEIDGKFCLTPQGQEFYEKILDDLEKL